LRFKKSLRFCLNSNLSKCLSDRSAVGSCDHGVHEATKKHGH
jgi:hypothetical protein